ncbi:MAG: hypothetical protein NWR21_02025 [Verrucomicrobiales bacterium]|nr:hypothetical protein [Verrucomicrobiales bacterium]MDP5006026.1 hypothetical protein [Verrucomicrobiales bacterium]
MAPVVRKHSLRRAACNLTPVLFLTKRVKQLHPVKKEVTGRSGLPFIKAR